MNSSVKLEQPLEVGLLFRRVRAQVLEATKGEQRPHEYHSLVSEHFLRSGVPGATSVTVEAAAPEVTADVGDVDVSELNVAQLRRIAEQGDADAQDELGARYSNGRGVGQNDGEAVSWYRQAADQGHARAQTSLGYMYSTGRGVRQDDAEAVR